MDELLHSIACTHLDNLEFDEAVQIGKRMYQMDPKDPQALEILIIGYYELDQFNRAKLYMSEAIEIGILSDLVESTAGRISRREEARKHIKAFSEYVQAKAEGITQSDGVVEMVLNIGVGFIGKNRAQYALHTRILPLGHEGLFELVCALEPGVNGASTIIDCIGEFGEEALPYIDYLEECLDNQSDQIQKSARIAIKKIKGQNPTEQLLRAEKEQEKENQAVSAAPSKKAVSKKCWSCSEEYEFGAVDHCPSCGINLEF